MSDKTKAGCDLLTIAFYFLLRVGEYTGHGKKAKRRTKQFRACDITFFDAHDNIIPNTAPLHILYTATTAVMRITNQKNGTRGSRISHTTSGTTACPVKALGRRVHYIMNHPECNEEDIISTYYSPRTRSARPLQGGDINKMIKTAVSLLGLDKKGFPPEAVSSHSLRAGGAMAMHLNNIDRDKIRQQGRCSSDTFSHVHSRTNLRILRGFGIKNVASDKMAQHRWTHPYRTSRSGITLSCVNTSHYLLICVSFEPLPNQTNVPCRRPALDPTPTWVPASDIFHTPPFLGGCPALSLP